MPELIAPYGGVLVNLIEPARTEALKTEALGMPSIDLDWRARCDLELLMTGAYSPLTGFMTRKEVDRIRETRTLADGTFWPLPLTLPTRQKIELNPGDRVALRDGEGFMLAVMSVADIWQDDAGTTRLGGPVEGVALPPHVDFSDQRETPAELRAKFSRRGWRRVVAWQARQPMHRPQYEFCLRTAIEREANLLIHPQAGGDLSEAPGYIGLMRSLLVLKDRFPTATTHLSLMPMQQRESQGDALMLRAIVARNFGCDSLIIGGEYEASGLRRRGLDVLDAARAAEVGVELIPYPRLVYSEDHAEYLPESDLPEGARALTLPGDELMRRLARGLPVPEWACFPEVVDELRRQYPPRNEQGFTVFFTGLSGAGKSTLARALAARLMETGDHSVTLLDGDIVRRHLSSELGFSKAHRDVNVRRIGYVASEITKNRGVAICAPIAPYTSTRRDVRAMIEAVGGFIEVFVSTPISTCEARDRKGLYAKARAGLIPEFTGVSDPYEVPEAPELALDTSKLSVDAAVQQILLKLEHEGYLR